MVGKRKIAGQLFFYFTDCKVIKVLTTHLIHYLHYRILTIHLIHYLTILYFLIHQ